MKVVTAHQPAYLPWLGYFHKIALSDVFVLLDDVQFEKNSFTNRNYIASNQGKILLTVPMLLKGHTEKTVRELEINPTENWRVKHWKTLEQNYRKAPYFDMYASYFESVYSREWSSLVEITYDMLCYFLKVLDIKTEIVKQSSLGSKKYKQDLVVDICRLTHADLYVSGKMGKDYLEVEKFTEEGISVYFQEYVHPRYFQYGIKEPVPYLGIVDLLFNAGKEKAKEVIFENNITREILRSRIK